ncbi:hypothetical protein P4S64_13575 [Vibrio sp. M60_M31a]
MQFGIDNQRYRILKRSRTGDYRLFFDMGTNDEKRWLYIGRYNHKQKLIRFCHWLQAWLVEINQQTETLHVVEPITLRHPESDIDSLANQVCVVMLGIHRPSPQSFVPTTSGATDQNEYSGSSLCSLNVAKFQGSFVSLKICITHGENKKP